MTNPIFQWTVSRCTGNFPFLWAEAYQRRMKYVLTISRMIIMTSWWRDVHPDFLRFFLTMIFTTGCGIPNEMRLNMWPAEGWPASCEGSLKTWRTWNKLSPRSPNGGNSDSLFISAWFLGFIRHTLITAVFVFFMPIQNSSQSAKDQGFEVNTFQFLVMFGSNFQTTSSESMVIANIGQVLFINGSRCGRESSLIRVKWGPWGSWKSMDILDPFQSRKCHTLMNLRCIYWSPLLKLQTSKPFLPAMLVSRFSGICLSRLALVVESTSVTGWHYKAESQWPRAS